MGDLFVLQRQVEQMRIERYAAIDIGSNAVRLLISNVVSAQGHPPKFMKSSMVRVPIRWVRILSPLVKSRSEMKSE